MAVVSRVRNVGVALAFSAVLSAHPRFIVDYVADQVPTFLNTVHGSERKRTFHFQPPFVSAPLFSSNLRVAQKQAALQFKNGVVAHI
jgi:hypothetical protein